MLLRPLGMSRRQYQEIITRDEIVFHVYPDPIPVSYREVLNFLPNLYKQHPTVSYFIHAGIYKNSSCFRFEQRTRKDPCRRNDIKGKSFELQQGEGKDTRDKLPQELWTKVDADAVLSPSPMTRKCPPKY